MAHGGGPAWNGSVEAAVSGLRDRIPLAVAFGMANPKTLDAALDSLTDRGANAVAVVRLFISGASFLHQTEFLLGLRSDPPDRGILGHRMVDGAQLAPLELEPGMRILLDREGMGGSEEVARILLDRAAGAIHHPEKSGVVLIAHGMGNEERNDQVLAGMEYAAESLRSAGYGEVAVATLREDWAEARAEAEREIRRTVERMNDKWHHVVVIPYRLSGFGPYAKVLDGLDYMATEGFLPHDLVTAWIASRATIVLCAASLPSPLGPCGADSATEPPESAPPSGNPRTRG